MPSNQILSAITLVAWGVILSVLGWGLAWPFRKASWRVGGVAVALLIGFSPILVQVVRGRDWTDLLLSAWPMSGGVELVFEPAELATGAPSEDQMDRLVAVAGFIAVVALITGRAARRRSADNLPATADL